MHFVTGQLYALVDGNWIQVGEPANLAFDVDDAEFIEDGVELTLELPRTYANMILAQKLIEAMGVIEARWN